MLWSKIFKLLLVSFTLTNIAPRYDCLKNSLKVTDENAVRRFVDWYDKEKSKVVNIHARTQWNYSTNMTAYNEEIMIQGRLLLNNFIKIVYENASRFDWQNLKNESLRRQMKEITQLDNAVLSEKELYMLLTTEAKLMEIYSYARICGVHKTQIVHCLDHNGVADIFASSSDESELRLVWQRWHENLGRQIKPQFTTYVDLSNKKAVSNSKSLLLFFLEKSQRLKAIL